ncbi:conjugal transfer protein TrbL family protein [Bacillus velezensis]
MKKIIPILFAAVFLFTVCYAQPAHADTGDFYEKYEKKFDKKTYSDTYIDILKSFDADTMSFDCGLTELTCHVMSLQFGVALGFANFVAEGTKILVLNPESIVEDSGFKKYKNYLDDMSSIMLSLFLVWQIMVMVARRFGDPDDLPQALNNKIFSTVVGAIFLGLYSPIFGYILKLQHLAISNLLESGLSRDQLFLQIFLYTPSYSILFGIFVGLINIIFLLALVYRFVAFAFFFVVGPVAIPTIVNDEFNYFQIWIRAIINNLVTLFCQTLSFVLALAAMTNQLDFTKDLPMGVNVVVGFILSLVFCFFALVIPSYLGNLGASTGTGRSIGRVVRLAVLRR